MSTTAPDRPHPITSRRAALVVLALLAALLFTTARPVDPAGANPSDEAAFVAELNQVRAGLGLAPLTVNSQLTDLARSHATVMADAGEIFHADPISAGYSGPWTRMGENVGVGASVPVLVDAFVASPGHYANIIDPGFTEIGVGVVWREGAMYTTHRFIQLPAAPAPAPPPTTAAPTTTAPPTSTAPPTTAPPVTAPPTAAPPTTFPATTAPPSTTTVPLPVLGPPPVTPERVLEVVELLDLIGT